MTRKLLFLLIFTMLAVFAFAAAPAGQGKPSPSDAQIERTLKAKLAKSKLNADHFTFSVKNGAVTIEGSTNVLQHKGVMTRMAKTSGATFVNNNIRVSDQAKARAAARLAGGRGSTGTPRATVTPPPTTEKK